MPRPSRKPAAIRAAAQRLFLQHGLQQTSMDAVAAQAGTTKQTVYRYFGSKERLFVAVLESLVFDRVFPGVVSTHAAEGWTTDELEDILLRVATEILDHVLDPTYIELVRILIAEAREFPQLAEQYRTAAIEPMATALADLIGSSMPEASDPTSVQAALRLFVAPIITYELDAMLSDPATVHERARAELPALVKLVVTAIKTRA
jgi:AcrR family transcriptional regulator